MFKVKYIIQCYDIAFETADVGHLHEASSTIALSLNLHNKVYGTDNLLSDRFRRKSKVPHLDHVLDPGDGISRCVGVNRGHATIVTCIHRLKHVKSFTRAHLTYNDPVRSHTEGVSNEITLRNLAATLKARRTGLKPYHVRLLKLQFCSILDGYDALRLIYQLADCVQ